jgi:hypothetical protein
MSGLTRRRRLVVTMVAAVVAGGTLAGCAGGGSGPAAAAASGSRPPVVDGPAPLDVLRACRSGLTPITRPPVIRALFRDDQGGVLWSGGPRGEILCGFRADGRPVGSHPAGEAAPTGFLPARGPAVSAVAAAGEVVRDAAGAQHPARVAGGLARGDVAEVTVTWPGDRTVTAARQGPYWVARLVLPVGATLPDGPVWLTGYDKDGSRLDRVPLVLPRPAATPRPPARPTVAAATRATLRASCARYATRFDSPQLDTRGLGLRAVFADRSGYLVLMGNATYEIVCRAGRSGVVDNAEISGSTGTRDGYLPRTVVATAASSNSFVYGQVRRDVARVIARWGEQPPVEAAVSGPYLLAGSPATWSGTRPRVELVAYAADGTELGRAYD